MGFVAKDSGGGDFKKVPPGVYIGRCYSLIDIGTQFTDGVYGPKSAHKIRIAWELFGEDEAGQPLTALVDGKEMPLTISKSYTVSLHEKASLRKDLAGVHPPDHRSQRPIRNLRTSRARKRLSEATIRWACWKNLETQSFEMVFSRLMMPHLWFFLIGY